jgi:two-component system response regulator DesR
MHGELEALICQEDDMVVVGDVDFESDVVGQAAELAPDVVVVNTDYMVSQVLPVLTDLKAVNRRSSVLILSDPSKPGMLPPRRRDNGLSFLLKDAQARLLANAIRRIARGEQVIDPRLSLALIDTEKQISTRELEVLGLAAEGESVADIASRLYLSHGTVRNHLSSVITKTGARNRIDAIRLVRKGGWLK